MSDAEVFRVVIFDPQGHEWGSGEDWDHARGLVEDYTDGGLVGWTGRREWYERGWKPEREAQGFALDGPRPDWA